MKVRILNIALKNNLLLTESACNIFQSLYNAPTFIDGGKAGLKNPLITWLKCSVNPANENVVF